MSTSSPASYKTIATRLPAEMACWPSCQNRPVMKGRSCHDDRFAGDRRHARHRAVDTTRAGQSRARPSPMNDIAERYVKLVLALGQHDADYVDAYYGPPEWKQQAESREGSLDELAARRKRCSSAVGSRAGPSAEMERCVTTTSNGSSPRSTRASGCSRRAAVVRRGVEGALRRGGADAARITLPEDPRPARKQLSRAAVRCSSRYEEFRAVRDPARQARHRLQGGDRGMPRTNARAREAARSERFTVEYVTNKSWSGYNWYQGNFRSLIQVNTDLPIYIDRAVDLACHEGYPGPPRLQRAAREAPGARPRLDRVLRLPAVLAAVADRRRHRQLRHRGGLPRPERIAFERAVLFPARRPRSGARRRVLTACRGSSISSPTPATKRRGAISNGEIDARRRPRRLERYALMPKDARRAARALLRPVPQLRDQLQPGQGSRAPLRRDAGRRGGASDARRWGSSRSCCRRPTTGVGERRKGNEMWGV